MFYDDKNDNTSEEKAKNAAFLGMPVSNEERDDPDNLLGAIFLIVGAIFFIGGYILYQFFATFFK